MPSSKEIIQFCQSYLEVSKFSDYCENGFHIEGKEEVKKIALGVSASKAFLEDSAKWGADLAIVHHGLIFGKITKIDDILKGRLEILIKNNMGLAGFHLPLDAHFEVGNNIVIAKLFGLQNIEKADIGFTGDLPQKMPFLEFVRFVEESLGTKSSFSENFGTTSVSRVCIISGGASDYSFYALESSADTFLFGELKESAFHHLKERGLNFIAAGHFATERFGIQKLGEKIAKEFLNIEVKFFDEECKI